MRGQKIHKRTSDALALVEQLTGKSRDMADLVEREQDNLDIARKIYELRIKPRLSQDELARKVGPPNPSSPGLKTRTMMAIPWPCCAASPPPWRGAWKSAFCPAASCNTHKGGGASGLALILTSSPSTVAKALVDRPGRRNSNRTALVLRERDRPMQSLESHVDGE
jgi:hypothetical protein